MTVVVTHSTPSDATFSATGATAWDATHTLTGLGTMAEQNANAVAITGGTATLTSVTTPTVQATNSAGLALKNSAGTTQISMGAGGGDNVTVAVSTNLNGTNAQIDISPTGTGHVHIKPTGVNSVEIAPTYVGEMDNIVIGAVTPKAGTFNTITGQTGVLRGTGQNLLGYSQDFTNASWSKTAVTATSTSATTDPLGGLTANLLTADGTTGQKLLAQFNGSNVPKTWSIYAKAGTNNFIQLFFSGDANPYANFNVSTGIVGNTGTTVTASITSVGNGWYRCSIATTSSTATTPYLGIVTSNTASRFESNSLATTVYVWGAQLELSSSVGVYTVTTSASIYGTPTLSFSGVSTLGLESNGALFLQPAGTGAIQAQATTSTTAGGNVRGANAVDWQTVRSSAGQVASGSASVVSGGQGNQNTGSWGVTVGGYFNTNTSYIGTLLGGQSNTVGSQLSVSTGGQGNTANGFYNFIGGGFTNSGTSASAVTTQSGTMNATTAVTLSGSNANIKVGQLIQGTSIASYTYVAAISGTSLTLSQAASGSSTSTLSFFTPHGVVVGGGNNQATGAYSFIGGGGDAGTAANRNVASGDWSFVGGGRGNTASGSSAVVVGGGVFVGINSTYPNTASGVASCVLGGLSNSATGSYATTLGGVGNIASGVGSVASGTQATTRSISGNLSHSGCDGAVAFALGVSQTSILTLGRQTTDATATALTSNSSAAGTTNQVILPNNSAYLFKATVISGVTGGGNTSGWKLEGVIKRGANAASTTIVGLVTTTLLAQDAGAATWAIAATADTTNGGLRITFTGQASTTIRTVCKVETTEMTY